MEDGTSAFKGDDGGVVVDFTHLINELLALDVVTGAASACDTVNSEGFSPVGGLDGHVGLLNESIAVAVEISGLCELVGVNEEGVGESLSF